MYYIAYGFLWLISLLPLRVLYIISDGIYGLVFYVFGYRKKIVLDNLAQAFPEKTEKERIIIAKKFYHNLIDTFIETIKLFSTGKKFIERHCVADFSIIHQLHAEGKVFQMHAGHQFNWEWLNQHYIIHFKQPLVAVYMPLTNKAFDKIFYNLRTRYGTVMLPATNMKNSFVPWRNKEHCLVLVADQNPGVPSNAYWFNFLNKATPFIIGPERSAREKKCPVVFTFVKKQGRGKYISEFILATEDASQIPEKELTKQYVRFLSNIIKEQPEMWLWSHRRWKHTWQEGYDAVVE
jgi:Kdo2-lipid IVA lauroyltransferase/acyltransferase